VRPPKPDRNYLFSGLLLMPLIYFSVVKYTSRALQSFMEKLLNK